MSNVLIARLSAGARRIDTTVTPNRPYLMFPATAPEVGPIMLFIGLSKAQRAPGNVADAEAQALGFADHVAAIQAPELTNGRDVPVRFEDPSDKGPGGWKIVTAAKSAPLDAFQDLLAAQG